MSIENQIERLIAALEANTGALIATADNQVRVVNTAAIAADATPSKIEVVKDEAAAPTHTAVEPPARSGQGRRPTRYWKSPDGSVVKSSAADAPGAGAVEITKDEYERLNHARATAAHVAQTTPQASEDPFGDAPAAAAAPAVTMDDVRSVALAYRDKHGPEAAKAIIKRVGGVDSLKDAPEGTWSKLIAAFNGQEELDL